MLQDGNYSGYNISFNDAVYEVYLKNSFKN